MDLNLITYRYYQFHVKSTEPSKISSGKSGTYDHRSSVVAHCTKLVHPSSIHTDFSRTLLSLPLDVQSNQCDNIIRYAEFTSTLIELDSCRNNSQKLDPTITQLRSGLVSYIFCCLPTRNRKVAVLFFQIWLAACKMLILASCIGVKDIESLLVDRKDLLLLSLTVNKLKDLQNQSPWSDLISQREKFSQSKLLLRVDCNKSIEDDNLWKVLVY